MLLHTPQLISGPAPDFSLNDPYGKTFSRGDITDTNGAVVAFICNHCPFVVEIADELAGTAKALEELGVGFVAIMPNDYRYMTSDSPENMLLFAEKYGFEFPYLVDEKQTIAKAYGAVCTPDFFGFDGNAMLQYRGRLQEGDLVQAMTTLANTGVAPNVQHPSKGCSIKWNPDWK